MLGAGAGECIQETLHRRVHGLAALDHHVGTGLGEGRLEALAGSHGDYAITFGRPGEAVLDGRLVVLEGHILNFQREELAPALAVAEHVARGAGVDVDLHYAAFLEADYGVAYS